MKKHDFEKMIKKEQLKVNWLLVIVTAMVFGYLLFASLHNETLKELQVCKNATSIGEVERYWVRCLNNLNESRSDYNELYGRCSVLSQQCSDMYEELEFFREHYGERWDYNLSVNCN